MANPLLYINQLDDHSFCDQLSGQTLRSLGQTKELYQLLKFDRWMLIHLELRIKNLHLFYCPADLSACLDILAKPLPDNCWFTITVPV